MPNVLEAFEVQTWDADGKNIISQRWYQTPEIGREDAVGVDKVRGPGSARLLVVSWRGVSPEHPMQPPYVTKELTIIDINDPDFKEYLRLKEKYKGLHIPLELGDKYDS